MHAAERCLQTAQAMGMGLFPNGTGPPGFPNQPVAVQTEQVRVVHERMTCLYSMDEGCANVASCSWSAASLCGVVPLPMD